MVKTKDVIRYLHEDYEKRMWLEENTRSTVGIDLYLFNDNILQAGELQKLVENFFVYFHGDNGKGTHLSIISRFK